MEQTDWSNGQDKEPLSLSQKFFLVHMASSEKPVPMRVNFNEDHHFVAAEIPSNDPKEEFRISNSFWNNTRNMASDKVEEVSETRFSDAVQDYRTTIGNNVVALRPLENNL